MHSVIVGTEIRQKVFAMENLMRQYPQIELKVIHHFSKGVYARELQPPAFLFLLKLQSFL